MLRKYGRTPTGIVPLLASLLLALPVMAAEYVEPPFHADKVAEGSLPPVTERLPGSPLVVPSEDDFRSSGQYGGDLRLLMARSKDVRMMVVYGYARLVIYTESLELQPDLLESISVEGNREFTLKLRAGHKWSDGHPFTSEDFRYFWEDIATDPDISPFGPPTELKIDDELPVVEFPDETTVVYRWSKPNPYFLPALAGARPLYIYAPAHYLKQFHGSHQEEAKLSKMVDDAGVRNWAGLHQRNGHMYKSDNPDLPTLQPWMNTTPPPSDRFIFVRNPYYHRVDDKGLQLPYIDRVLVNISSQSLIPAKTGAGESDLQARYLRLDNYTFLKEGEDRNNFSVRLWQTGRGSQMALYPNLNSNDETWRALARDVRVRRALSMGIDRSEINQLVYFGLAQESNNTVLPSCPLFKQEYQDAWTEFDTDAANALLDEVGLVDRDKRGVRLMPDGRPLEIVVHTAGESTEQTDILELIHDSWMQIGVKIYTKPSQRELFRDRVFAGDAMMSVWEGVDNAIPTADTSPDAFVPVAQDQLQWPKWGQYYQTASSVGEAPDVESAENLMDLRQQWRVAESSDERAEVWQQILDIHRDEVFSIGTVCGVPQPVVVNNRLRNVPDEGVYSWEPGSYFGLYRADQFWFDG